MFVSAWLGLFLSENDLFFSHLFIVREDQRIWVRRCHNKLTYHNLG